MFFLKTKQKPTDSTQPKPRSALRVLLSPNVGASIRPLQETTTVFINLLALIFATQGLFPRNHPALTGVVGAHLSLSQVLSTAWDNLVFEKSRLPQIVLFFAVIASLFFVVMAFIIAVFSMFIGKAHAQSYGSAGSCGGGGYFLPCDASQDIALGWLNYLFKGQIMYNYLDQYGQVVPQSTAIQQGVITALAFYSNAILVVAAIILFYHLASMIVETAHHGVVMGKRANQVWAPIRLVVAIGLLVPISGGLNSGQYIVIQIATWGSNLATETWSVFVNKLAAESYQGVAATAPYARKTVYDTVMMEACAFAYNQNINGVATDPTTCTAPALNQGSTIAPQPYTLVDNSIEYVYDLPLGQAPLSDVGICGHSLFPAPPQISSDDQVAITNQQKVQSTATSAYTTMQAAARSFAQTNMLAFLPSCIGGTADTNNIPPNPGDFETLVTNYQNDLQNGLNSGTDFSAAMMSLASTSSAQGWVSAGAWFNTVAREQSALMNIDGLLPSTQAPELSSGASKLFDQVLPPIQGFEQWLNNEQPGGSYTAGSSLPSQQQQIMTAVAGAAQANQKKSDHLMDEIFRFVDVVASWNDVWQSSNCAQGNQSGSCFSLGVQFTGANPLAEIAHLGHANINTAYDLYDWYFKFQSYFGAATDLAGALKSAASTGSQLSSSVSGKVISSTVAGFFSLIANAGEGAQAIVGTVLTLVCAVFFGTGALLAFFLPLLPFFRFLFNVLTWIVSVLEAVVAVPLIALAHLNPEGDGLHGATAKASYHFVFNIFLRPVLMVFGLILGLLIFYIAVSYMNMLYMQAIAGAGGLAYGHLMLSRLIYTVLYVFVLYMCANSSFHMIDFLPEHAMRWMGAQGLSFQKMGDPESLATPISAGSAYADQQILQGTGKLHGAPAFAAMEALRGHATDPKAMLGDAKRDLISLHDKAQKFAPDAVGAIDRTGAAGMKVIKDTMGLLKGTKPVPHAPNPNRGAAITQQGPPVAATPKPPGSNDPNAIKTS